MANVGQQVQADPQAGAGQDNLVGQAPGQQGDGQVQQVMQPNSAISLSIPADVRLRADGANYLHDLEVDAEAEPRGVWIVCQRSE